MKKPVIIFVFLAMLYCAPTASGQQIVADVRYLPMLEIMQTDAGLSSSYANGVDVGIGGCYYGGYRIGFDVAANYRYVFADSQNGDRYRQHAIVAPLHLNFSFMHLGYSALVFIYGGPTLECGLGSSITDASGDSINLYSGATGQNRFNAYMGAGLGIRYHRFFVAKAGYERSIYNELRGGRETNIAVRDILTLGISVTLASFWDY